MFPGGQFVKSAAFISSARPIVSSVHCGTGPEQNVDDDYCACQVKVVGRGGGVHIIGAPHFFLNRGPLGVNPALNVLLFVCLDVT